MAFIDILIVLVLATLPAYFFKKKLGIEIYGPLCLWRTKKGLKLLDRLSKYKRFLTALSEIGFIFAFGVVGAGYLFLRTKRRLKDLLKIVLAYIVFLVGASVVAVPAIFTSDAVPAELLVTLSIGGTGFFILHALLLNSWIIIQDYLTGGAPIPGLGLLVPGVEIPGSPISIPLHAIFGLIVLIVVHEVAHGVVARMEQIKVKSMGLLTAGIFPIGAFTEPDEKQLKRVQTIKRMRVFSVGSMSNFVFGIIFLVLFLALLQLAQPQFVQDPTSIVPSYIPLTEEYTKYLTITFVQNNSPAQNAGISPGMKFYNIDLIYAEKTPFANQPFVTDNGTITVQRNASGYLGLSYMKNIEYPPFVLFEKYLIESIFWIFILNFLIGVINYLPFAIFDGARIFEDLIDFYAKRLGIKNKKTGRRVVKVLTVFILILLMINALPYFIDKF